MKISNSELNKALKKLLQYSVGSHAVVPRPEIDAHIFQVLHQKRMAKAHFRKRLNRMRTIGLVILISLSTSLFIKPINQSSMRLLKQVKNLAQPISTRLQSGREKKLPSAQPRDKLISSDSMEAPGFTAPRPNRQTQIVANQIRERLPASLLTKRPPELRQITSTIRSKTNGQYEAGQITPLFSRQGLVRVKSKRSWQQPTTFVKALDDSRQHTKLTAIEQGQSVRGSNSLIQDEGVGQSTDSVSTNPTNELADLKPLAAFSFAHRLSAPSVEVVPPAVPNAQAQSGWSREWIEKTTGLHWLIGVTPLTTRQRVILLQNPAARVQDVRFPQGLAQSVGYKLNVGVEQNGFQLLLSYTQLRMRSEYAYSTDQYVVEENGSYYRVKRIGTPAATTTSLQLAGVAIRKQLDVNHRLLGRFFGSIGLEYGRSLNAAPQQFVFISATVGKTIRLHQGPSLYVGPYVDYSFTKIHPIDQLKIRPYQAGLSVAIKLGQHTH